MAKLFSTGSSLLMSALPVHTYAPLLLHSCILDLSAKFDNILSTTSF